MSPLGLLRACHPLPAAGVTLVSGVLALGMGHRPGSAALVTATVAASQLAVGWTNDAIDAGRDGSVGRTDKPLAAADPADRRTVAIAAVVATAVTIAAALAWGWPAAGWALLGLVAAQLYNWPLKSTPASIVPYLVSFATLPAFVSTTLPGAPAAPGWLMLAAALLCGGAHLLNAIPDLAQDAATGVRGLPQRLGARGSLLLASVLLLAATVTLVVGARPPWWASTVALALAVALTPIGWYAAPRVAFRAVIAVAALDVLVLAVSGAL